MDDTIHMRKRGKKKRPPKDIEPEQGVEPDVERVFRYVTDGYGDTGDLRQAIDRLKKDSPDSLRQVFTALRAEFGDAAFAAMRRRGPSEAAEDDVDPDPHSPPPDEELEATGAAATATSEDRSALRQMSWYMTALLADMEPADSPDPNDDVNDEIEDEDEDAGAAEVE